MYNKNMIITYGVEGMGDGRLMSEQRGAPRSSLEDHLRSMYISHKIPHGQPPAASRQRQDISVQRRVATAAFKFQASNFQRQPQRPVPRNNAAQVSGLRSQDSSGLIRSQDSGVRTQVGAALLQPHL